MSADPSIKRLNTLYREDPDEADRLLFGRRTYPDRRGFLKNAGLAAMGALVGAAIPFHRNIPAHFIPVALAAEGVIPGKDGLTVLNDRPMCAETPPHLLDDTITLTERHFVRNNGLMPEDLDASRWQLAIDGLVDHPMTLGLEDLRARFEIVTRALVLECAGNGRAFFDPKTKGEQWTYGAVACSEWTGVRLSDVLEASGIRPEAVYTAHYGADTHLSGTSAGLPISRGVPIDKAMDPHNLIAFAQNGRPIHPMNGGPLRLIIPGWPGSCSQKWLTRVEIRDRVHDGPKMTGTSYRMPDRGIAPGETVDEKEFRIIEHMPVKSLITHPATAHRTTEGSVEVHGHAWTGEGRVDSVDLSIDFGATWMPATLDDPVNAYAWQNWRAAVSFPREGYYEVWTRATDSHGVSQPHAIAWNPGGYLNNAMHRIAVYVE
ncbi:MAG: sulfite oxidase [Gemmatimonadetes bacterium]|nr:sulfite oxidase [Gemmatimonadota bacterium]